MLVDNHYYLFFFLTNYLKTKVNNNKYINKQKKGIQRMYGLQKMYEVKLNIMLEHTLSHWYILSAISASLAARIYYTCEHYVCMCKGCFERAGEKNVERKVQLIIANIVT